jgi:DNA-binding CsgD family transcriptional regulator
VVSTRTTNPEQGLFEREREQALLGDLVEAATAGQGRVALVEGQAGVGKTELLRAAGALGHAAGLRVLRARGAELDRAFAFGVARQLLERPAAEAPGAFDGAAGPAARVLGPDGFLAPFEEIIVPLRGLTALVAALAEDRPLVLLADDLHWADTETLRWLVFLADRVEDLPVLIVGATRPSEPGADQELLDALAGGPAAVALHPAPLSAGATASLVRARLPEAADAFAEACHRATGGNPFLLGELLEELTADGVRGEAAEAEGIAAFGSEGVGRSVRRRLRSLPAEATAVAQAAAVLGPRASLDLIAGLAELDRDAAARGADALAGIHLLAVRPELDFVHPVVRTAVHDQISPLNRQALHARAVALLSSGGARPDLIAPHVLRLPPADDPDRVATLRDAARDASGRGGAGTATVYLRRALEEPPPDDQRAAVLHELGVAEATDRRHEAAETHLRDALAAATDPDTRAAIALDLGRALGGAGLFHEAVEVLDAALSELSDPESDRAIALEAEFFPLAFYALSDRAGPRLARRLAQHEAGEPLAPPPLAALMLARAGTWGPVDAAVALVEPVLATATLDEVNSLLVCPIGNGLIYAGEHGQAAAVYDAHIALATRRGNGLAIGWQSVMRADASLRLGQVGRAEAEARAGLELFEESRGDSGLAWALAHLVRALTVRGALEEADEQAHRITAESDAPSLPLALLLTARAELHLTLGRPTAALIDARAAGALIGEAVTNPAVCPWRSAEALALAALDRGDDARAAAAAELTAGRGVGAPEAEGTALRTLGLVTGAEEGIALLRESVGVLETTEGRLEHMRALLELGAALRRAGERVEARDHLRAALDLSTRAGATLLADRAHEELVAAGARPRRERRMLSGRESLTASEDRVALLAAEGLTNREIAQQLFVTVKAVQWHLRNVYRKLDVGSREELPEMLALGA